MWRNVVPLMSGDVAALYRQLGTLIHQLKAFNTQSMIDVSASVLGKQSLACPAPDRAKKANAATVCSKPERWKGDMRFLLIPVGERRHIIF